MFIAMNRFKVKSGSEEAFEKVWLGRETYLDGMPGFMEFHLAQGAGGRELHALFVAHRVGEQSRVPGVDDIRGVPKGACSRWKRDNRLALSGTSEV